MILEFEPKNIKNFPSTNGVYGICFKNCYKDKLYIGSAAQHSGKIKSVNGFYSRWKRHLWLLRNNKHHSTKLQNAFLKYGEENITFRILEVCDPENCISREQFYIDKYDSFNNGYNLRPKADNNLGFKQTCEFKKNIFDKNKKTRDAKFEEVKKLYDVGKTTREISKKLKISRSFITKMFKENNVKQKNVADYTKKKLFQYDTSGNFIKEWDNIRLCSSSLNIKSNNIRDVTNGRSKHAKGFYFSLIKLTKEEVLNNIELLTVKSKNRKYLNIKQLDGNKAIIKQWRDIKEIIDCFKFSNTTGIIRAITGEVNKYKGFYWTL